MIEKEGLSKGNLGTANMADDTEALKHNFFLRGFFHHRGYYNLNNISPETYRKDRVFSDPANERASIPAAEPFIQDDSSNSETLAPRGKALLQATLQQD